MKIIIIIIIIIIITIVVVVVVVVVVVAAAAAAAAAVNIQLYFQFPSSFTGYLPKIYNEGMYWYNVFSIFIFLLPFRGLSFQLYW